MGNNIDKALKGALQYGSEFNEILERLLSGATNLDFNIHLKAFPRAEYSHNVLWIWRHSQREIPGLIDRHPRKYPHYAYFLYPISRTAPSK